MSEVKPTGVVEHILYLIHLPHPLHSLTAILVPPRTRLPPGVETVPSGHSVLVSPAVLSK